MKVSYADVIINLDNVKIIRKALRPNNNGCWELVDVKPVKRENDYQNDNRTNTGG